MMKTLKIGIVGAGFAGQQHIEAIRRIPGTDFNWRMDPGIGGPSRAVGDIGHRKTRIN